ncbi:amidase family protein [Kribbella shirazensis]|uniref:Amidase n=1 Tax=Kribbella shirazensis TaxID=1105143 RepID=A0A7X5VI52_9ACTN|nr:amidase family protein [Kribbella shirazensis]NIK60578.1 amidase [Kribbella shirazensis]
MDTAGAISERIRTGQVSSREVTEELLARIADDTQVNAVVEVRREDALAAAERADVMVTEGAAVGPLHGVPMTVKDCFDVAGMHTTWGNPAFAGNLAAHDAAVVERLQRAGAVVVGKSNVHTMLADFGQTANEIYGRTNNPADLGRTPGGSSGGGAAALAADLTYLEYGSDLVGSIRLPAAYCGVYGLRPTNGLVPLRGFQVPGTPYLPSELPNLSTIGPLARSAADLRTALRATAGPDAPYSYHLRPPRHTRLQDYRVGVFGRQVELFFALHGDSDSELSLADLLDLERRRMRARRKWQRYFEDVDVFLCPTSFTVAFPHGSTTIDGLPYETQVFWIAHASLTGHPALSMPIGRTPEGLPVGGQVIGPWHEDDTAITFAELLAG